MPRRIKMILYPQWGVMAIVKVPKEIRACPVGRIIIHCCIRRRRVRPRHHRQIFIMDIITRRRCHQGRITIQYHHHSTPQVVTVVRRRAVCGLLSVVVKIQRHHIRIIIIICIRRHNIMPWHIIIIIIPVIHHHHLHIIIIICTARMWGTQCTIPCLRLVPVTHPRQHTHHHMEQQLPLPKEIRHHPTNDQIVAAITARTRAKESRVTSQEAIVILTMMVGVARMRKIATINDQQYHPHHLHQI